MATGINKQKKMPCFTTPTLEIYVHMVQFKSVIQLIWVHRVLEPLSPSPIYSGNEKKAGGEQWQGQTPAKSLRGQCAYWASNNSPTALSAAVLHF